MSLEKVRKIALEVNMNVNHAVTRRRFVSGTVVTGAGLILNGAYAEEKADTTPDDEQTEKEVTATEDLMREHGVLRRVLFLYSEAAARLHRNPADVPPQVLNQAAQLFHIFGEEYHEKKLEEAFIFPAVKNMDSPAARYPDILIAQHQRGRAITDFILTVTRNAHLSAGHTGPLVEAMVTLVRMYRPHAAREDTVVFPAWKQDLTAEQLDDMNETFEDIEHQMFGQDGFTDAVSRIHAIEEEFGMSDLSEFTAPAPPAA